MPPSALPKSEIQRLIEAEAVRQGLTPEVVVAIARQESGLNPTAVGDNGKSLGLFQLQRAAAIDAGIDLARRGELHENIRGGVTYFNQKLQQSGGNVEQALSRYNRGTPTYRGIGDPNYVQNVLRRVGTDTPEAAPRRALLARVGGMLSPRSPRRRRQSPRPRWVSALASLPSAPAGAFPARRSGRLSCAGNSPRARKKVSAAWPRPDRVRLARRAAPPWGPVLADWLAQWAPRWVACWGA